MHILLTGANGYIGQRLLPVLLEAGHTVFAIVRNKERLAIGARKHARLHICEHDFLESAEGDLPQKLDAAYFLIHSMSTKGGFAQREEKIAQNFNTYITTTSCKQVVYLSGIANADQLSEHLESRHHTEQVLRKSGVALTVLRAGIIVGSGSASFEIIRDLVEKLPVMVAPKWVSTRCQPIAIRNVIQYLTSVLGQQKAYNQIYDIGGPDILTYKEMLLQFAAVRGLKRWIITVPVLTPRLSSRWLYFVTSTSYALARNLVDSMKVEVIARDNRIASLVPVRPIGYREAVELAFQKMEQNMVLSSWKDALITSRTQGLDEFLEVPKHGCFKDRRFVGLNQETSRVIDNIFHLGGERGYYYGNWLWKLRGYLDKLVGGIGLRRGRRSPSDLHAGDALDFWRVLIANRKKGHLLLYAEMRLPGEAWLEFKVVERKGRAWLRQEATFRPLGLWGRLYWAAVWPFHLFVFQGMLTRLAAHKSQGLD